MYIYNSRNNERGHADAVMLGVLVDTIEAALLLTVVPKESWRLEWMV